MEEEKGKYVPTITNIRAEDLGTSLGLSVNRMKELVALYNQKSLEDKGDRKMLTALVEASKDCSSINELVYLAFGAGISMGIERGNHIMRENNLRELLDHLNKD